MVSYKVSFLLLFLFISIFYLSELLKPTQYLVQLKDKNYLDKIVPLKSSDWNYVRNESLIVKPAELEASLASIYNMLLERNYINSKGQVVMLSIAYGLDQRDAMAVHLPEGCYKGQGFSVNNLQKIIISTSYGDLPSSQMTAEYNGRVEDVIYWTRLGGSLVNSSFDRKMKQLTYALDGRIPDGLIFRVSTIRRAGQSEPQFDLNKSFIKSLLDEIESKERSFIIGDFS